MKNLIDRTLLIRRKLRAMSEGTLANNFLLERAVDELLDRLSLVDRVFQKTMVLFSGPGQLKSRLTASGKTRKVKCVELHEALLIDDRDIAEFEERIPVPPASVDLAISLLSMHAVNDLPGFLIQIRKALRPDGLFIGAFAGAGTLGELRESLLHAEAASASGASPRIYPFADIRDAGALLQRAGFALPVADVETMTVRYDNAMALMRDLRAMGETSALTDRSRKPLRREILRRACAYYQENFADPDGKVRATANIIWLSGWAPHGSQQKPLRPGSARSSLADALRKMEDEAD